MTYKYRIYTFQNGLGETIFRAKRVRWLPAWATAWVSAGIVDTLYGSRFAHSEWQSSKWRNREALVGAIQQDAQNQYNSKRHKMGQTLKLVMVEDESVEVQ